MDSGIDYGMERCDTETALSILQHPTVVRPLGLYATEMQDHFEYWLLDKKILVVALPDNDDIEVHIACKRKDRAGARASLKKGLGFFKGRGFKKIWTSAPNERNALTNMLKSLGFASIDDKWVYE